LPAEDLSHQGSRGSTMGNNNENNTKTYVTITTFDFPIRDIKGEAPMKNIPLPSLPSFQGMIVEDNETFLFDTKLHLQD